MRGLVLVFSLTRPPTQLAGDAWLAPDKLQHFFAAAFVQSMTYGALRAVGVGNGPALAGASLATVTASVGKELYDMGGRGDPSAKDLVWDAAGGAAASVLLVRTVR